MKKDNNIEITEESLQKIEIIEYHALDVFWIKEEQLAHWRGSSTARWAMSVILLAAFWAGLPAWFIFQRYERKICRYEVAMLAGEAICDKELRELAAEIVSKL
jgi:hypothetical protein